jgi:redox-sensitive bicupin YhaK (pirin superfamily)
VSKHVVPEGPRERVGTPASDAGVATNVVEDGLFNIRTRGHGHGPITRLLSPGDRGHRLKPFVFLDAVDLRASGSPGFGGHPHSGVATATVTFDGTLWAKPSTGQRHLLLRGGIEWVQVGAGVWHRGGLTPQTDRVAGVQPTAEKPAWLVHAPARKQPFELALGRCSVHTSASALARGEPQIRQLQAALRSRWVDL